MLRIGQRGSLINKLRNILFLYLIVDKSIYDNVNVFIFLDFISAFSGTKISYLVLLFLNGTNIFKHCIPSHHHIMSTK